MRFEMVGVQLDQARHDQIAADVLMACGCITFAKFGDPAIRKGDPAPLDHAIGQNDPGVAKYGIGSCRSHLRRFPSCRRGKRRHVDDPVGDQMTYLVVVDDSDHRNARAFLFIDHIDNDSAIGCVQ